jgi:hypothetical protein
LYVGSTRGCELLLVTCVGFGVEFVEDKERYIE